MFASAGALACAGEEGGVRYVITGFEIFPFDGLRSATVSIFTLNALRWLFANETLNPGSEQARLASPQEGSVRVGQLLLPPDTSSARMIAPQQLSLSSGESRSTSVPVPGIVAVSKEGVGAQDELLLAANSFSTEESDLSRRYTLRAPVTHAAPSSESQNSAQRALQGGEKTFFEQTFVLLLLAVLIADLIRRIASRSRWGNSV
jgi:hypothetical protein